MTDEEAAFAAIGAAIEVHRILGPGFPESVYEQALAIELDHRRIPFQRQHVFTVVYKGEIVGSGRADFLIADALVLELKSVERLTAVHGAQVMAYLNALNLRLGLVMNFNSAVLKGGIQRVVRFA
jgi:GxxExxY protein